MKPLPEPRLRVFYSPRGSIVITKSQAERLYSELAKWVTPPKQYKNDKDVYMEVENIEELYSIPSHDRRVGMHVYNRSTGNTYRLGEGLANNDWISIEIKKT